MIKVTYLDHSGFVVVLPEVITVFDYYRDPANALPRLLKEYEDRPIVFFVSHSHADHYTPDIFNMAQNRRRVYIVSNDVPANGIDSRLEVQGVSPGDELENLPGDLRIKVYGSTDRGVSFLVTARDGRTIFHAGDLNYWHWNEEATPAEVRKAYNEYVKVMHRILDDVKAIDIVFFPVDPRLGQDYAEGARLFLENINVRYFFPMHFWGDYKAGCDFEDYSTDNTEGFCLHVPGESIVLENEKAYRLHI